MSCLLWNFLIQWILMTNISYSMCRELYMTYIIFVSTRYIGLDAYEMAWKFFRPYVITEQIKMIYRELG